MGEKGIDIKMFGENRKMFPFATECKRVESLNHYTTFYVQTMDNAKKEKLKPLLVSRKNNKQSLVTLTLDDFLEIYSELLMLRKTQSHSSAQADTV